MKNNLKVNRIIKGYSQEQLARLAGVSRQTIHALEAGKYVPSTTLSLKLSLILGQKTEDLFELEERDWK